MAVVRSGSGESRRSRGAGADQRQGPRAHRRAGRLLRGPSAGAGARQRRRPGPHQREDDPEGRDREGPIGFGRRVVTACRGHRG